MSKFVRFFRLILCLAAVGFAQAVLRPVSAQATLDYGQTVTGKITNDAFRTVYTFEGRTGDIVDITLTNTGGTLDPMLILLDDQNNVIARNDDSGAGTGYGAEIMSQQLPRDGVYFLIVTRFGQELGLTTGTYSLTLARVGITEASSTALQYGDSVVGEIKDEQYQHVYAFRATRGDMVRVTMQRISGDLDSFLILADSQGNVLLTNDEDPDSPGTLDAAITNYRIWTTGNYILVATRFGREAGQSYGGFALTLDRVPPDTMGKGPEKAILVDYGGTAAGSIDSNNVMRFYVIQASKGDILTINADRTSGNLDPILVLYTADLRQVASNDSGQRGQNARITAFSAPASATYILVVSRYNLDKGITAGNFTLSVNGYTRITLGPGGKATLTYNSAISAILDDSNIAQQYTFAGTAGDVVTITLNVTSGNLIGQLSLFDPAKKLIQSDDPGLGNAKLVKVKLPVTGQYTVVASRHGRDKGGTRGAYLLLLSQDK